MQRAAIILAAGKGTRMKSSMTKVLHEVGARPMLDWSLALAEACGCGHRVLVVGTHSEELSQAATARLSRERVAIQDPPQGTGHAVSCSKQAMVGFDGNVVVLYADTPLLPSDVIEQAFAALDDGADISVVGFRSSEPGGYGRLVSGADGTLERIVEANDASEDELKIDFCNSGILAAHSSTLFRLLEKVTNENAKGEYYLTDLVGLARDEGLTARAVTAPEDRVQGVNSRVQLAEAEKVFQKYRRLELMEAGVTMRDPDTVFFSWDTEVEPDVVIEPFVMFGPGVKVASHATIRSHSSLEGCTVERGAQIGPFARLRPGAEIGEDVRIGNFVEVKNTRMGAGAKANHLAYLGDGDVGANANIGAGTIFCNYDGYFKHRTTIGEGAFIGSNSSLVAPVEIGKGAYVGSGSTVTKPVEDGALGVARGRQTNIGGWAERFHESMKARKAAAKDRKA